MYVLYFEQRQSATRKIHHNSRNSKCSGEAKNSFCKIDCKPILQKFYEFYIYSGGNKTYFWIMTVLTTFLFGYYCEFWPLYLKSKFIFPFKISFPAKPAWPKLLTQFHIFLCYKHIHMHSYFFENRLLFWFYATFRKCVSNKQILLIYFFSFLH